MKHRINNKTAADFSIELQRLRQEIAIRPTPQLWANVANSALAGSSDLSPWFPSTTAPAHVGWYQRFVFDDVTRHYGDGTAWLVAPGGQRYGRELNAFWPCWRGLSSIAAGGHGVGGAIGQGALNKKLFWWLTS